MRGQGRRGGGGVDEAAVTFPSNSFGQLFLATSGEEASTRSHYLTSFSPERKLFVDLSS